MSPKTRLPSQPPGNLAYISQPSPYRNSAKRKMADRKNSAESQRIEWHGAEPQINGTRQNSGAVTSSPQHPARKRVRYTEPPIWARSVNSKISLSNPGNQADLKVNGSPIQIQVAASSLLKSETNGHQPISRAINRAVPLSEVEEISAILGPWEPSISYIKPTDAIAKEVADWLFRNVVSRPDIGELTSRGVQVEIEAKLGQLIDKDTGVRFSLPIRTEAVLEPLARIGFISSMTEVRKAYRLNWSSLTKLVESAQGDEQLSEREGPRDTSPKSRSQTETDTNTVPPSI